MMEGQMLIPVVPSQIFFLAHLVVFRNIFEPSRKDLGVDSDREHFSLLPDPHAEFHAGSVSVVFFW